ncbi:MAG: efflux RND transporter periplasmic adaptor subunit, partial [Desulfobacterales bacterium]
MMRNKRLYWSIVFATLFFLLGCGEKIEPGNVEPTNKGSVKAPVVSAKIISQPLFYESVGTVNAKVVSTISSKLMGSVRKIFVREGDHVNKGDQLAVIDDRQVLATLREAKAALAQARRAEAAASASAELASVTYARYQNLMKDESASPQEFDEVKSRYQQAQAELAVAKQRVKQAEASLS